MADLHNMYLKRTVLLHYVILPPGEILDHINGSFSFWLLVVVP